MRGNQSRCLCCSIRKVCFIDRIAFDLNHYGVQSNA